MACRRGTLGERALGAGAFLALAMLGACVASEGPAASTSSSHWLVCDDDADCAPLSRPFAVCGNRGVCVDGTGEPILWRGESAGDDDGAGDGDGHSSSPLPSGEPLRVLASGEDNPWHLAIDDRYVYWTTATALKRAPLSGGEVLTLAIGRGLRRIAVADGQVFFTDGEAGTLQRVDRDGGTALVLGKGVVPDGIAVHDSTVYWTNSGMTAGVGFADGELAAVAVEGGMPRVLLEGLHQPSALVALDDHLYFTSASQSCGASSSGQNGCAGGGVRRVPLAGGDAVVVSSEDTPYYLTTGPKGVYWMIGFPPRIMFAPADGGPTRVLAEARPHEVGPLAVDADAVYLSAGNDGRVLKMPIDGGALTPIATDLGSLGGITVDDDWVYVAASGAGQILRVAKDGAAARPTGPLTGPCPDPIGSPDAVAATPRAETDLEMLALGLDAGEVVASEATYGRVMADVMAIRALAPSLADIRHRGRDDGRSLILRTTDMAASAMEMGLYSAWDCLNDFYTLESTEPVGSLSLPFVVVTLKGIYNLELLATLYAQLPGIEGAEANSLGGDGPTICARRHGDEIEYVLDRAGGDCPAGCTTHDAHRFVSRSAGDVEAAETWNSEEGSGSPAPEWFTRACRR